VPVDCGAGRICIDGLGCREECDCQTGGCSEAGAVCAEANALQCYCKNCSDFSCVEEGASACGGANSRECICNDVGQCVPDPCAGIVCPVGQVCVDGQCVDDGEPCDTSVTLEKIEDGNNCDLKASWANDCCPCPALEATITPTISGNNVDFSLQFKKNGSNLSDERQDNKVVGNDQEIPTSGSVCARVSYLQEIVIDLGGGQTRTRTVVTKSIEYPGASFNGSDVLDINGVPINLGPVVGGNNIEARVDIILKPTENSNSNCTWGGDNGAEYYSYRVTDINQIDVQTNTINSSDCGNAIVEWNRDDLGDFIRVYTDLNEHVLKGVDGGGLEDENLQRKILGDQLGRLESCHTYKATVCCCGEGNATEDVVFCKSIEESTAESLNICNTEIRVQIPDSCDVNDANTFNIKLNGTAILSNLSMRDQLPYDDNLTYTEPITSVTVEMNCVNTGDIGCTYDMSLEASLDKPQIVAECAGGERVINSTGGNGVINVFYNNTDIYNSQYTIPRTLTSASAIVVYGDGQGECYRETVDFGLPSTASCCDISATFAFTEPASDCTKGIAGSVYSIRSYEVSVSGGTLPITYAVFDPQSNQAFPFVRNSRTRKFNVSLPAATTSIPWKVTDANGCEFSGIATGNCDIADDPIIPTTDCPNGIDNGDPCTVTSGDAGFYVNCECIVTDIPDTCGPAVLETTTENCLRCRKRVCQNDQDVVIVDLGCDPIGPDCGNVTCNGSEVQAPNGCGNCCEDIPDPCNFILCSSINTNNYCGTQNVTCCDANGNQTTAQIVGTKSTGCETGNNTCELTDTSINVTSSNLPNSSINVTATWGVNFQILDSSNSVVGTSSASNLPAGNYTIIVDNGEFCTTTDEVTILPEPLNCTGCTQPNSDGTSCNDYVTCAQNPTGSVLGTDCSACNTFYGVNETYTQSGCYCEIKDTQAECDPNNCSNELELSYTANITSDKNVAFRTQNLIAKATGVCTSLSIPPQTFNCADVGQSFTIPVSVNGLAANCSVTVTVTDTNDYCSSAPSFGCIQGQNGPECSQQFNSLADCQESTATDCKEGSCPECASTDCNLDDAKISGPDQACFDGNGSIILSVAHSGVVTSYSWSTSSGGTISGATNQQSITATSDGNYIVTITNDNIQGCGKKLFVTVSEFCNSDCPDFMGVGVTQSPTPICTNNNETATLTATSGYNYLWEYNGNTFTTQSITTNPSANIYSVTFIDPNNSDCKFKVSNVVVRDCDTGGDPTGACCRGESCTEGVTQADCLQTINGTAGVYQGDNSTCSPNPCSQNCSGACGPSNAPSPSGVACGSTTFSTDSNSECVDDSGNPCWTVVGTGCAAGSTCNGTTCVVDDPCGNSPVCDSTSSNAPCCCEDEGGAKILRTATCPSGQSLNAECTCVGSIGSLNDTCQDISTAFSGSSGSISQTFTASGNGTLSLSFDTTGTPDSITISVNGGTPITSGCISSDGIGTLCTANCGILEFDYPPAGVFTTTLSVNAGDTVSISISGGCTGCQECNTNTFWSLSASCS